jgi:hypothetical protein
MKLIKLDRAIDRPKPAIACQSSRYLIEERRVYFFLIALRLPRPASGHMAKYSESGDISLDSSIYRVQKTGRSSA